MERGNEPVEPNPIAGRAGRPARREAGFTLIETLISLAIAVGLILVALTVFSLNRRVSRLQTDVTLMQQAVRAVHLELASQIRMAGRGGLAESTPARAQPDAGVVVGVARNVQGAARTILPALGADSPKALAGTDVLTLRGVLDGPIYYGYDNTATRTFLILRDDSDNVTGDPAQARTGVIDLCTPGPTGLAQPLDALRASLAAGSEEALLLVGSGGDDDYAVVKLVPGLSAATSTVCDPADASAGVHLEFVVSGDGGRADAYHQLSTNGNAGLPAGLTSVAYAGILEEYRYYVREVREDPTDPGSSPVLRFSRARLYPNTGEPWGADAAAQAESAALDLADDVLDFQVSLGFDTTQGGGALEDGSLPADGEPVFESADGEGDDWLFNSPDDDPASAAWGLPGPMGAAQPWRRAHLFYVRLTTVGRAGSPLTDYQAPLLARTEDRVYDPSVSDDPDSDFERQFHRWVLTTTVDLRNL